MAVYARHSKAVVLVKLLIFSGLVLHFAPWWLKGFCRLPADLYWKNENFLVFIPVISMIIIHSDPQSMTINREQWP